MERLKVAICGGGIASICLAHALINKHPRSEIKIFEANHVFREEGAAIGLGSNAQEALSLISPDLRNALDEAGGTQMDPSVRVMMVSGIHPQVLSSLRSSQRVRVLILAVTSETLALPCVRSWSIDGPSGRHFASRCRMVSSKWVKGWWM